MDTTAYARGAFCRFVLALVCVALLSLPAQAAEVTVSAAASLTNAFTELKGLFEKKHTGLQVNTNFAASNPLLKQIQEGAPVDAFASADQGTMDKAVAAKVVDPATRKNFALNDLVLIVPAGSKKPAKLEDIKAFKRVAMGNPDSVPAGRYSKDALTTAGFESLQTICFPQPCYPSGWWSGTMARKRGKLDSFREAAAAAKPFATQYYNLDMHKTALAQPEFLKRAFG